LRRDRWRQSLIRVRRRGLVILVVAELLVAAVRAYRSTFVCLDYLLGFRFLQLFKISQLLGGLAVSRLRDGGQTQPTNFQLWESESWSARRNWWRKSVV